MQSQLLNKQSSEKECSRTNNNRKEDSSGNKDSEIEKEQVARERERLRQVKHV